MGQALRKSPEYNYYAFISYSRKDRKWAKALQRQLETYRLPTAILKRYNYAPKRLAPVFRDETDLSGTVLADSLHRELDASRYLIVICSPRSAASEWVNDELAYFIAQGRQDQIIPYIIDGEPFSGGETECLPPAIRELQPELLGISQRELGRRGAFLRVVSTLLNIRYDEIAARDKRRRRFQGSLLGGAAAVLLSVAAAALWYNLPHSSYYSAYVYQNEIPRGLYELSESQRAAMNCCYRITTQRGKVVRLECVNSAGSLTLPTLTYATSDGVRVDYTYDSSGALASAALLDQYGQLVAQKRFSSNRQTGQTAVDYQLPTDNTSVYALSSDMSYQTSSVLSRPGINSEITRELNTYDEQGRLLRTVYQSGSLNVNSCDANGVYGKQYEYNEQGQIIRVDNLNEDGEVGDCKYGWATFVYTYDAMGRCLSEKAYDEQGSPTRSQEGIFAMYMTYDQMGNLERVRYCDESGALSLNKNGYAEVALEYDERGNQKSQKLYDAQGGPVYDKCGVFEYRFEYDEAGRISAQSFFDETAQPVYHTDFNAARMTILRNEAGKEVEMRLYDAQGEPTCVAEGGIYGWSMEYDENGYQTAWHALDGQGQPMMSKYGYAAAVQKTDEDGRVLRMESQDETGELVIGKNNCAIVEYEYDTFGNCISYRYMDEEGMPCNDPDGVASRAYTYEDGKIVSEKFYNTEGEPTFSNQYYHEVRYEYDERGNCIRESYHDTNGALILLANEGYAILQRTYDSYGNVTSISQYDEWGKLGGGGDMLEQVVYEYDKRGNLVHERKETTFFDPEDDQWYNADYYYDGYDRRCLEVYYGYSGEVLQSYAYQYDSRGYLVREESLGADGSPKDMDDPQAFNAVEYAYDSRGSKILEKRLHLGDSGEETVLWQREMDYDSRGNLIEERYLDGEGNLTLVGTNAAARIVYQHTPRGEVAVEEYYDQRGEPLSVDKGMVFRIEMEYDAIGRKAAEYYYDQTGQIVSSADGMYASKRYEYNRQDIIIAERYYDEAGRPYGGDSGGYAWVEYLMDDYGYERGRRYYDQDGTLLLEASSAVYLWRVVPGTPAQAAGLQAGDYLIQWGDWNYLEQIDNNVGFYQIQVEMREKQEVPKQGVFCRFGEDGGMEFFRVELPAGYAGVRIVSEIYVRESVMEMLDGYVTWLEHDPA